MNEAHISASNDFPQVPILLRQAREAAGLHIGALAAALKVPVKKLEALEAGRYDDLPDLTFARALASSVCRHLKVDPAPVLEQIPLGHTPALGDGPSTINAPFKATDGTPQMRPSEWLRKPAVLISCVLLAGAAVIWFVPDVVERLGALGGSSSSPDMQTEALPLPSTTAAEEASTAMVVAAPATAPSASSVLPEVPTPAASAPATEPVTSTPDGGLLSLRATSASWVEVVDGKGATQVQRMLAPGDVLEFSSTPPYAVVIGRADAVQVTVRGEPFDLAPHARNSVARFKVK